MAEKSKIVKSYRHVLLSDDDPEIEKMMKHLGFTVIKDDKTFPDIVVFTGGADIHPYLYGQRRHATTFPNPKRDLKEVSLWKSMDPEIPKLGICRGAQLGNVMCGGSLLQNINNHKSCLHMVRTFDDNGILLDDRVIVNSDHHQMVLLAEDAEVLAVANMATRYETDISSVEAGEWRDIEAFYYEHENFLGIQWHPEWNHPGSLELFEKMFWAKLFNRYGTSCAA